MYTNRRRLWAWIFGLGFIGLMAASSTASAGPVSDIADGLNDALFGGGNLFAAQALLTAAVMVSVGLALAILGLDTIATFIVLFAVLGALTAIGWADPTMLLLAGLLVAGMFVSKMVGYFTGGGTSGGGTAIAKKK
jgi:hypothetical protein